MPAQARGHDACQACKTTEIERASLSCKRFGLGIGDSFESLQTQRPLSSSKLGRSLVADRLQTVQMQLTAMVCQMASHLGREGLYSVQKKIATVFCQRFGCFSRKVLE